MRVFYVLDTIVAVGPEACGALPGSTLFGRFLILEIVFIHQVSVDIIKGILHARR